MYRSVMILFIITFYLKAQRNPFEYGNLKLEKFNNKQHPETVVTKQPVNNHNNVTSGVTKEGQLYTLSFEKY